MLEDAVTPIETAEADLMSAAEDSPALKLLRPEPVAGDAADAFDLFSVLGAEEPDLGPVQPENPRPPVAEAQAEPEPASEPAVGEAPAPAIVRAQSTVEIVGKARRSRFRR